MTYDNGQLLNQFLSAVVLAAVAVLPVLALYIITLLKGLMRDAANRAEVNHQRDHQRDEIQENVRRLVNGNGVQHDPGVRPDEATHAPDAPDARHATYPAPQLTARVVSIRTDDVPPTEPRHGSKEGI